MSNYPPTCVGLNISKYVIKKLMMIIIHYITRQNQSIGTNYQYEICRFRNLFVPTVNLSNDGREKHVV